MAWEIVEEENKAIPKSNGNWSLVEEKKGIPLTVTDTPTGIPDYDLTHRAESIAALESGNNYKAIGQPVKGNRAYGKYQIMQQNIPEWSKKYVGREVSLDEFMNNPEIQDKIALGKLKELKNKGYSPQDSASIWNSGRPLKGNNSRDAVSGASVNEYVQKFNEFYGNPKALKTKQENPNLWKAAEWLNKSPSALTAVHFVNALGDIAGGVGLGAIQGVGKGAASVGNLAIDLGNMLNQTNIPNIKSPNMEKIMPQSGYGQAGKFVGDIVGQGAVGGGAYKALGAVPMLGNEASFFANLIRGMGAGAATGEEAPGGRLGSAAIGGAVSPLSQLTNKAIADRVLKSAETEKGIASKGFKDVFSKTSKDEIVIPEENIDFNLIRKSIPNKERMAFDEYLKDPTIENAHKAQSLLGSEIRNLNNEIINQGRSMGRVKRLNELTNAQESIKKALSKELKKSKGLNEKYISEKKSYKENVVPYETKDINLYKAGKKSPKHLVNKLSKDYEFMKSKAGKKHGKSISAKKFIDSVMNKQTAKGAGLLGLGALGYSEGKKTYDRYNED